MKTLEQTINNIKPLSELHMNAAKDRLDKLIKPVGSLGKLEDICIQLS
ncbi:nicotinate-nucleotide--dimethylbenzimidazole phosphoribosyltransferase, partial [Paraclostridium benzoelyticum]|nr:nicotinate-nucleotide--dimethylbenzimidazole phosphoribosyltransferase [Paraclostridium benzoelyticum]